MSAPKRAYRTKYEALFLPIGRLIAKTGIKANHLTTLSILVAIGGFFFYSYRILLLGLTFMILASIVDMLDGSVARATDTDTRFGSVFDPVADRYVEFFFLLGMDFGEYAPHGWVLFTFCGMIMASYVRARAESSGGLESCSVGIAERKEKMTILGLGTFFEFLITTDWLKEKWAEVWSWSYDFGLIEVTSDFGPLAIAILIVGILSHISAMQRLSFTFKATKTPTRDEN
ncbi:MAG: CDP-alcohol phosphatidyltransferase family protein [Promethearchaeota archaeon]